ncbi:MAG: phosphatidylserine/phosphatidylglycerophosphate/cardiolipin synthase family protein [Candidatus Sericytochromatia bacterium]
MREVRKLTFNNSQPKFYIDGHEIFPAIINLIRSAKKTLYIETFIFHFDETGKKVAKEIIDKKNEGVEVKVIIDSIGLMFRSGDYEIVNYLMANQVDVLVYNKYLISTDGVNITHRKMIIVDGERAIVGGANFGEEYENTWHDTMTELEGEIVQEIQDEFFYGWHLSGGIIPENKIKLPQGKKYGHIPMKVTFTDGTADNKLNDFEKFLISCIFMAEHKIKIANPYFSDINIVNALIEAKNRDVEIDIVIPKENDTLFFSALNFGTAKKLVDNEINVHFYNERFSHTKAYIIDDIVIVGSSNLDPRSLKENQELSVIIYNHDFMTELEERLFNKDIKNSELQTLETLKLDSTQDVLLKTLDIIDYYFYF